MIKNFDYCIVRNPVKAKLSEHSLSANFISLHDFSSLFFNPNESYCLVYAVGIAHGNYDKLDLSIKLSDLFLKEVLATIKNSKSLHFIYLSSINIGLKSKLDNESSVILKSKVDEENYLAKFCEFNNLKWTVVRMPLVYGVNTPANFGVLIRLARLNFPLPFGGFKAKSSFLYVGNLLSFIEHCSFNREAFSKVLTVSDCDDKSLVEVLQVIRRYLNISKPIFSIPIVFFKVSFFLIGRSSLFDKLYSSNVILLPSDGIYKDWRAPYSFDLAIQNIFRM